MLNPPAAKTTTTKIGDGYAKSIIQFSNTRSETHFSHTRPDDDSDYVTGEFLSCFSPMPDTATQIAAALKANANYGLEQSLSSNVTGERSATTGENSRSSSNSAGGSAGNNLTAGGGFEGSLSTTVIQLDGRTELVVAARDIFNSLCMFYVNGMLTQDEVASKFDDTLEVIKDLAESEKSEAEAKKKAAEAQASNAAAKEKAAEAALIKKQADIVKQTRATNAQRLISFFTQVDGTLDTAKWATFLSDSRLPILLGGYNLNQLNRTTQSTNAVLAELKNPRYDDDLVELIEIAAE